jgi:4-hydroxymandelate oxidase
MSRFTRRRALESLGSLLAASPLLQGQELVGEPPVRIVPRAELVNVFEVEAVAKRKLPGNVYSMIAGGDRRAFDRITFRPRMLVDVRQLDLTAELFGEKLFTPILAGPVADQRQFHPEGELATVRGAASAKTVMVVSSRSSDPIEKIAGQAKTSLWYQVYPEPDVNALRARVQEAVAAGCKAVCLTVGTTYHPAGDGPPNPARLKAMGSPKIDWAMIDQLRQGIKVPFLLKGIMSPEEAQTAVQRGVQGIVVSNHGGLASSGLAAPIEMLPSIADAVGGRAPILIDGSFRRGTDVLKALALGARAVLIGRPVLWGLSAYGADGVQTVLGMLQSELARSMGLCGKVNIAAIDRSLVKIHLR